MNRKNIPLPGLSSLLAIFYVTLVVDGKAQENNYNRVESRIMSVDLAGSPVTIGHSKTYSDGFGNLLQSQVKSFTNNQVIASQLVYDYLGQPALQTLPAPIHSANFGYKDNCPK